MADKLSGRQLTAIGRVLGILGAALLVLGIVLGKYTVVNWRLYSGNAAVVDVTDRAFSPENYESLHSRLPDTRIIWNVPLSGGSRSSDSEAITVSSLTRADLQLLPYLPDLKTIRAEQVTDEETGTLLCELLKQGDYQVFYTVTVAGQTYGQDTQQVQCAGFTRADAGALQYLPALSQVSVSGCEDYALLQQLRSDNPRWNLEYTVALGDSVLPWDTKQASVSGADAAQLEVALAALPCLEELRLENPAASYAELAALSRSFEKVRLLWDMEIFGRTLSSDITELDISGNFVSVEEAKAIAAAFPHLEKLIMTDCGIANEEMAAFREQMRQDYLVVWTVYPTGDSSCRTDATWFFPTQQREYYFQDNGADLQYCEALEAIDLGHHTIIDISFLEHTPHVKYLILAHTRVSDITPLSGLKELVFLELDWSEVRDYSPLVGCTALEDLNLGLTYGDYTPILQMTWLKNLWWMDRGNDAVLALQAALPDTKIMYNIGATVAGGWRNLPNYFKMRDALHAEYMSW